jgi:hypothetical protein
MEIRPTGPGDDRGQIIIVAALVIAMAFVGLALVLNSGIYAENLSSRQTTDVDGALAFSQAANETVSEAYERANAAGASSADEARDKFTGIVDRWETSQRDRAAVRGIGVEVERTPHVGWRLEQDADRTFTPADGSSTDWSVVDEADGVAEFTLEVSQGELYTPTTQSDVSNSFRIEVNGSDDWNLYVFENSTETVVYTGDSDDPDDLDDLISESCTARGSMTTSDLRNASVGGTDCPALNFSDDLNDSTDVSFRNVDAIQGTYTLVINGSNAVSTDADGSASDFHGPGSSDEPTAQAVVYSVSYVSHYERKELTHRRSGRYMVRDETYAG